MAYKLWMEFQWDEVKSNACLQDRGFNFAYATQVFLDPHRIVAQDSRRDYGEDRFQVLGIIDHRVYAVVFTMRNTVTRIISARRANAREVQYYEYYTHQG